MAWRWDLACLVGGQKGGTRGWNAARCFRQAACVLAYLPDDWRFSYSCFPGGEVVVWEGDVSKAKAPHCSLRAGELQLALVELGETVFVLGRGPLGKGSPQARVLLW